jgi:hypothetical protein
MVNSSRICLLLYIQYCTFFLFSKCFKYQEGGYKRLNNSKVLVSDSDSHRLNMEVVYLGSMSCDVHSCTHWLRPRYFPPSPALGLVLLGRYWSAKRDDISL